MEDDIMHGIAATIDFVSALFIVVIIFGIHITIKEPTKKTRYFSHCLYICLFALIMDAVAYLLEIQPTNNVVLWIFNYFAFVSIDCVLVCYFLYLDSMVSEKECIFKKWFKYAMIILCGLDFFNAHYRINYRVVIQSRRWNFDFRPSK